MVFEGLSLAWGDVGRGALGGIGEDGSGFGSYHCCLLRLKTYLSGGGFDCHNEFLYGRLLRSRSKAEAPFQDGVLGGGEGFG